MYLGIEIGGTKLQLGVGPGDGTIVALERARVDPAGGAEGIRGQIVQLVPPLLSRAGLRRDQIRAAGIGFGGPVDADRGIVTKSHQVEGWAGFPLADWCRGEFGWPTVVHNDADTAGLAESCFGAGRGFNPVFYITIGSGIGGGLIIDQKIYRGSGAGAAEIGHLRLPPWQNLAAFESGEGCAPEPLFPMTLEGHCSGWGLARRLRHAILAEIADEIDPAKLEDDAERALAARFRLATSDAVPRTAWKLFPRQIVPAARELLARAGGHLSRIDPLLIAEAARDGNLLAQTHLAAHSKLLGWGIANMIALVCPRRIIIGGGVSLLSDMLFEPLRAEVDSFVFRPFARCFDIVPASLGEAVVVHGALRLAKDLVSKASGR